MVIRLVSVDPLQLVQPLIQRRQVERLRPVEDVAAVLGMAITDPSVESVFMVDQVMAGPEGVSDVQLGLPPLAVGLDHFNEGGDEPAVPLDLQVEVPVEGLDLQSGVVAWLLLPASSPLCDHGSSGDLHNLVRIGRNLIGILNVEMVHQFPGAHFVR